MREFLLQRVTFAASPSSPPAANDAAEGLDVSRALQTATSFVTLSATLFLLTLWLPVATPAKRSVRDTGC